MNEGKVVDLEYFLRLASNGNEDAYKFLRIFYDAASVWDDLVDKDKQPEDHAVDNLFNGMFFELSKNKFYHEHKDALSAGLFMAANAWKDSNEWRGNNNRIFGLCAWFIRHYFEEMIPLVAWLAGGYEHARSMSLEFRKFALETATKRGMDGFFEFKE